jgi:hypothetical protein
VAKIPPIANLQNVSINKMKFSIVLLLMHLTVYSIAQTRFIISDTNHLVYSRSDWEEIDSVVFIFWDEHPSCCDSYEVYFDENLQHLAYKSESIGDSCISYDYWRGGQLKKRTVHLRDNDGIAIWWSDEVYCENGSIIYKGPSLNQPGKKQIINYYCNGNKKIEFYHMGIGAEGKMTRWYENGNLESESFFENNEPIHTWKYYNLNGELIREEFYETGKLSRTVSFCD